MYTFKTNETQYGAETVKMADLPLNLVLEIFRYINLDEETHRSKIKIERLPCEALCPEAFIIITDTAPKDLIYPEGWYYAKGCFRNKHTSSSGLYSEVSMQNRLGVCWSKLGANYCTK